MATFDIELHCTFCDKSFTTQFEIDGWTSRYENFYEGNGLCKDHAAVAEFLNAQCPGCVGGWGECGLYRAFTSSGETGLSEKEYSIIESGICPRRVNGTMMINMATKDFQKIHIEDKATKESGKAMTRAIREYLQRWPKEQKSDFTFKDNYGNTLKAGQA